MAVSDFAVIFIPLRSSDASLYFVEFDCETANALSMNDKFRTVVEGLDIKFEALLQMPHFGFDSFPGKMPEKGVYAFSENGTYLYVGRSNRLKCRLREHCKVMDAPFAFRLAREATGNLRASYATKGSRKELLSRPDFSKAFTDAKERISRMQIQFVEEKDPINQVLLEIYASVVLETPYNEFKTT